MAIVSNVTRANQNEQFWASIIPNRRGARLVSGVSDPAAHRVRNTDLYFCTRVERDEANGGDHECPERYANE